MREETIRRVLAFVLCLLVGRAAAFCFPDFCKNLTELVPTPDYQCLLTSVRNGKDCAKFKFEDADETSSKHDDTAIFTLSAYVADFGGSQRATAFNLSVSDINFHRLSTRYQYIVDENESVSACRHVELYGNSSHPAPKHLFVSCPFTNDRYEGLPYRLEYAVVGDDFAYSRKYMFYVPQHRRIADGLALRSYTPFIYVDVSDSSNLALHVQPLPPKYNVTRYRVWLTRNETESVISVTLPANEDGGHVRYNFTAPDGVYFVKVAALHPDCDEQHGCVNSTSPYILIKHASDRLLIMIISMIWIPPVLLYALYHAFKLHRKRVLRGISRRPNCLLIYSPTHVAHVQVMEELTKYLQCCNINAMIDILNIRDIASQDPGIWCNMAFRAADVVLVATSPPSTPSSYPNVYRNVDKHLLRLLKENYPQRNKRYYALHLPYCETDDIPEEARLFKMFRVPRDLRKLVKTIHGIGCLRFRSPRDNTGIPEILYSIQLAADMLVKEQNVNAKKKAEETGKRSLDAEIDGPRSAGYTALPADELLSSIVAPDRAVLAGEPVHIDEVIPQSFATDINELNLLGENEEKETARGVYPVRSDCEFRIDRLNL
ncbi:PREDICTED: uncharacterized protein LOC106748683 [Dinoponera quadriceps]|uniref:Uncharacterized protein LOC106748683 n=1 Tax=Dinoponera quadriceps TaxID=609295 RepID=A0A6P3XYE0_DINQU|nr:PREDICTED: uncharacterized protein LOC106748683 [Dinoponera quadriceps]